MSKAGNFVAYRETPLPDRITPMVNYWAEFNLKKDQIEDEKQQRERLIREQEKAKKQKKIDEYGKYLTPHDSKVTGINQLHGKVLQDAMKEYEKLIPTLLNSSEDSPEYLKAKIKIDNLHNLPDKLKMMSEGIANPYADYQEGRGTKYVDDPRLNDKFKDWGNLNIGIDEDGNPLVAFKDTDGDGINDLLTYNDLLKGESPVKPILKLDFNKEVVGAAALLNKEKEEKQFKEGYYDITTESVNPERVNQFAKSILYNPDGSASEKAKSFLAQQGVYDFDNQDELKKLEKTLIESINPLLGSKRKEDFNRADENADLARQQRERQFNQTYVQNERKIKNQSKKDGTEIIIGEPVMAETSDWNDRDINTNNAAIPIKGNLRLKTIDRDKNYTDPKVIGYHYDKKNRLIIKIEHVIKEKGKEETVGEGKLVSGIAPTEKAVTNVFGTKLREAELAGELGISVKELRAKSIDRFKNVKNKTTDGKQYKGIDENGNAIYE